MSECAPGEDGHQVSEQEREEDEEVNTDPPGRRGQTRRPRRRRRRNRAKARQSAAAILENEDLMSVRPARPELDAAINEIHRNLEELDGVPAIITRLVEPQTTGFPEYMAVLGVSREIRLEPYTAGAASGQDWGTMAAQDIRIGDVVMVKERTEHNYGASSTAWVIRSKMMDADCIDPTDVTMPRVRARVEGRVGLESVKATVAIFDRAAVITFPEDAPGEGGVPIESRVRKALHPEDMSVGMVFEFVPLLSDDGELAPVRSNAVFVVRDVEDQKADRGESQAMPSVSPDDIDPRYHYVGKEVLDFVAERFGVIGDLTIGSTLSGLPLSGGRAFAELLQEATDGAREPRWGDMVTAAIHVAVQHEMGSLKSGTRGLETERAVTEAISSEHIDEDLMDDLSLRAQSEESEMGLDVTVEEQQDPLQGDLDTGNMGGGVPDVDVDPTDDGKDEVTGDDTPLGLGTDLDRAGEPVTPASTFLTPRPTSSGGAAADGDGDGGPTTEQGMAGCAQVFMDKVQGKSKAELSQRQCHELEAAKAEERSLYTARLERAKSFMRDNMSGKALFFNPAPERLEEFADWLTRQMREAYARGFERRAVVAVDVAWQSSPDNLLNIQMHPLWQTGRYWYPKSFTLLQDNVIHARYDRLNMGLEPVNSRMGKKLLLIEYDSSYVAHLRPMPVEMTIDGEPRIIVAAMDAGDGVLANMKDHIDLDDVSRTYTVTLPYGDRRKRILRRYKIRSMPCSMDNGAERWIVRFHSRSAGEAWIKSNCSGTAGRQLLTAPRDEFGDEAINLVTAGHVAPSLLYEYLQAEWVEMVGKQDDKCEYRFKTRVPLKALARGLYSLNRFFKWSRTDSRLRNTFVKLKTDTGHYVNLRAGKKHSWPVTLRYRTTLVSRMVVKRTRACRWFSVTGLDVGYSQKQMRDMAELLAPGANQIGVEWNKDGTRVWISVSKKSTIAELERVQVVQTQAGFPLLVRAHLGPPGSLEPLPSTSTGSDDDLDEALKSLQTEEVEEVKHTEQVGRIMSEMLMAAPLDSPPTRRNTTSTTNSSGRTWGPATASQASTAARESKHDRNGQTTQATSPGTGRSWTDVFRSGRRREAKSGLSQTSDAKRTGKKKNRKTRARTGNSTGDNQTRSRNRGNENASERKSASGSGQTESRTMRTGAECNSLPSSYSPATPTIPTPDAPSSRPEKQTDAVAPRPGEKPASEPRQDDDPVTPGGEPIGLKPWFSVAAPCADDGTDTSPSMESSRVGHISATDNSSTGEQPLAAISTALRSNRNGQYRGGRSGRARGRGKGTNGRGGRGGSGRPPNYRKALGVTASTPLKRGRPADNEKVSPAMQRRRGSVEDSETAETERAKCSFPEQPRESDKCTVDQDKDANSEGPTAGMATSEVGIGPSHETHYEQHQPLAGATQ